ncbi:MAG: hypothetical protein AAB131_15835 [Actinomycetota bacterium]
MSSSRSAKRQLEKARQERQAMKRDRKRERGLAGEGAEGDGTGEPADASPTSQEATLAALAALHDSFEGGSLEFEDFEAAKAELIGRLRVE